MHKGIACNSTVIRVIYVGGKGVGNIYEHRKSRYEEPISFQ